VSWRLTSDLDEYLAAAGALMRARPVENTVLLTVVETLRARGVDAFGAEPPLFGWWETDGAVAGACLQTTPYPLALTDLPEPAVAELASILVDRPLSGVGAEAGVARAFAAARGGRATLRRRECLYRLGTLVPPPAPPGRAVASADQRHALLVAWMREFLVEIHEDPESAPAQVDNRLAYGGLRLWERDRAPVSMAVVSRPVAGMVRVGPVYTPPEQRGRGYGAAVTAALCRAARDDGVENVLLFADADNPLSNRLYRRLGFEARQERLVISF
jgi:predicted GNAT family acetyltransferase